jgi:hypothetical protein
VESVGPSHFLNQFASRLVQYGTEVNSVPNLTRVLDVAVMMPSTQSLLEFSPENLDVSGADSVALRVGDA